MGWSSDDHGSRLLRTRMPPIPDASVSTRRIARALVATASALALLVSSTGSIASTRSQLDAAKSRLTALTGQIGSEEAQARWSHGAA